MGFIRDLPHKLIEAFEATLQEACDADLLLHVIDAASPVLQEQRDEVERVLQEIGAGDVPQILVYNKLDRVDPLPRELQDWVERVGGGAVPRVFVSALRGTGLDTLRGLIAAAASEAGLNPPGESPPSALAEDDLAPFADQAAPDVPLPSAMT